MPHPNRLQFLLNHGPRGCPFSRPSGITVRLFTVVVKPGPTIGGSTRIILGLGWLSSAPQNIGSAQWAYVLPSFQGH